MFSLKLIIFIPAITLRLGLADYCVTPNNETAACTLLYDCPILLNVISDSTSREFIRRSNCGGTAIEPKVCCGSHSNFTTNECVTPNNETAVCTSLYSCPMLLNALLDPTKQEFARQSNCGGTPTEPWVCCGSQSNFTTDECMTPNNETAVCTSLYSCSVLVNALLDPTKQEFVRQSNCGGTVMEPKVCCGSYSNFTTDACVTPNNETAVCTSLYSCPILLNALSDHTNREFIYQSNCGGTPTEPKVCCGTHSNFTRAEMKKQKCALKALLPKRDVCGLQQSDDHLHTGISEYSWLAVIVHKSMDETDDFGYRRFCSGSLISKRYVLTTAECLLVSNVKPASVRLGDYHMSNKTNCLNECSDSVRDFGIEKFITHPDYVRHGVNPIHNIGLIRLDTEVNYTNYIRPICLPLPGIKKPEVGDILTTSGWGVGQSEDHSETKKRSFSKLITNQDCENRFREHNITVKLEDGEACGVLKSHSELICVGDGGIPVTYSHQDQWYQDAIVSVATCKQDYPNIYTEVAHYLGWIEKNLEP